MTIKFKKLSEKAVQPVRTTTNGAGYNLTAARVETEVNERGQVVIAYHTDIAVEIPEGYEATIRPLANIHAKTLRMSGSPLAINGTLDDEIVVRFISTTDVVPAVYKDSEQIAQLVINKIENVEFIEFIDTTEQSAAEESQSLPESEGEPTNSDDLAEVSGGEENIPEQA